MAWKITRREFLGKLAVGSFWTAIVMSVLGMIRLPKPAVMPEVSSRVKLGYPYDFLPGTVRKLDERNLFVFSDAEGIYAISAICTHLGCIVDRVADGGFECPCHGSMFRTDGKVVAGPAPRGLEWIEIWQTPNGLLYADISKTVPTGTKWRA